MFHDLTKVSNFMKEKSSSKVEFPIMMSSFYFQQNSVGQLSMFKLDLYILSVKFCTNFNRKNKAVVEEVFIQWKSASPWT